MKDNKVNNTSIDPLVLNLNPRARVPRGFDLWSIKLQRLWLKSHQCKPKAGGNKPTATVVVPKRQAVREVWIIVPVGISMGKFAFTTESAADSDMRRVSQSIARSGRSNPDLTVCCLKVRE